jgi:hypothetical protein
MGKKTNWTLAEDQALCRAWLHASDSGQLQAPEHRASTFWMAVHQLFHAELGTTVERPVNGLKIRWTRINRDVQKFAVAHSAVLAAAREDAGVLDAAAEAQLVAEARTQFEKERETKFLFESCWRLLRYSPKWMLNLSNATGVAAAPPPANLGDKFLSPERPIRLEDTPVALSAESFRVPPALQTGGHKRRAPGVLDGFPQDASEQLAGVAGVLVEELRRRNELLEEQNAMTLLRLDAEMAGHDDARAYLDLLRQRYLKKMRLAVAVAEQPAVSSAANGADAHLQSVVGAVRPRSEPVHGELEEEEKSEELAV